MIEYLLNFLERMEEGFGETSDDKMHHMRMSEYVGSESGGSDRNTQASSDNNSESQIAVSINESQRLGSLIEKNPSL